MLLSSDYYYHRLILLYYYQWLVQSTLKTLNHKLKGKKKPKQKQSEFSNFTTELKKDPNSAPKISGYVRKSKIAIKETSTSYFLFYFVFFFNSSEYVWSKSMFEMEKS